MPTPVCDHCDGYIESTNRRWPGYCSPSCRTALHEQREAARRRRIAKRLELAQPKW